MKSRRSSNSSWRLSTFLQRNSRRYGRRATNVLGLCTGCCERYRMARRSLDSRTGGLAAYGLRLTAYSWLLLSLAVQRPQPPHQIDSMDPNDWAIADQFGEQPERSTVVRIIERRHENHVVGDVEIRIARREPLALEGKRCRHRQGDDFDFRAVLEPHPLEPLAILPQRPVVRVAGIRLAAQHHGSRSARSSSARGRPGFRTWTAGSSRHCSVVRSVPRPLTSMLPPSSTTSRSPARARNSRRPSRFATRSGTWSSRFQSAYFAQALKRKRAMATSGRGRSRRTNR